MDDIGKIEDFLASIIGLLSGDRAALKRSAGTTLIRATGQAMTAFYKVLPNGVSPFQEDKWYAVACIAALWKDAKAGQPFEKCLKILGTEGIERRVKSILDDNWDEDGMLNLKLFRLAKMMYSNGLQPDFSMLLKDLINWNHPNRFAQKKWARVYFSGVELDENIKED